MGRCELFTDHEDNQMKGLERIHSESPAIQSEYIPVNQSDRHILESSFFLNRLLKLATACTKIETINESIQLLDRSML